jgi:hypothetical protein
VLGRSNLPPKRPFCTSLIPLCSPEEARRPTALALGSFDGLHAGHRRVIAEAIQDSPDDAVASVVSFWPHPREVLFGEIYPAKNSLCWNRWGSSSSCWCPSPASWLS